MKFVNNILLIPCPKWSLSWLSHFTKYLLTLQCQWVPIYALLQVSNGIFVSETYHHLLKLWDLNENIYYSTLMKHGRNTMAMTMVSDNIIAVGGMDYNIKLWHLKNKYCVDKLI